MLDHITLTSSYSDTDTESFSAIQAKINRGEGVDTSVGIKAFLYDLMALMSVMGGVKKNAQISDIDDAKARVTRRSLLHLSENIEGSGNQSTFSVLKVTKIASFNRAVKAQEAKMGESGLIPFKAWMVEMKNHSCK